MAVNNMLSNVPGAVPYVSMVNDQANAVLINALNEKTKQYEQQLSAIAENEALLNQMKYRDPDRAGALLRAAKISSDLDKEIQEKYAGDYGSIGARKVVASRLAQERGIFSTLQQKYEEEQPYKQMYHQLKATGQLAKKKNPVTGKIEEVNPFAQSIVDAEGNLVPQTNIDYGDIRKRGDYIGYVTENIVNPLNKRMQDLGLKYRQGPFYGTKTSIQRTKVGMSPEEAAATIDDNTAKRFLEENPNYAFEFGTDIEGAKNFIKDIVRSKVSEQIHPNYGNVTDPLAALKYKEAHSKTPPYRPKIFLPPSQEQGEVNPFITARQQEGKSLTSMLRSGSRLMKTPFKDSAQAIADINKMIASQFKQRNALKNNPQAQVLIDESIRQLRNSRTEMLRYNKEVEERKTNWFDQAAQSITGSPDARYKNLTSEQRRKVRAQAPKNEEQWAKYFDADLEGNTLTTRNERPLEPKLQKYIGSVINYSGNYFRSSKGGTASKNFKDVADEAGVDELALKQAIQTRAFPVHRIDATGEYAIRIPKDLKINSSGKLDYKKTSAKDAVTLYFTFDNATQQMSEMLRWAEQNRFETGKKSKTFNTAIGQVNIEKTSRPNLYKVNGQLMTKNGLEQKFLEETEDYISNTYSTYLPSEKLNQPTEEYLEE